MKSVKEATAKLNEFGFEVYMSRGKYNLGHCGQVARKFPQIVEWTDLDPRSDYGSWQLKINGKEMVYGGFDAQGLKDTADCIVSALSSIKPVLNTDNFGPLSQAAHQFLKDNGYEISSYGDGTSFVEKDGDRKHMNNRQIIKLAAELLNK